MTAGSTRLRLAAPAVALLALLSACSSSSNDAATTTSDDAATTTSTSDPPAEPGHEDALGFDPTVVGNATVSPPTEAGAGEAILLPSSLDLSTVGYEEQEFFVSGTATDYTSSEPLTEDGMWAAEPDQSADFTTRIIVRRPIDDADFNGTVFVEWLNVTSGLDIAPDWTFGHVEIIREGAAWIGVSAQVVGIDGTPDAAGNLALKALDPVRYGPLDHPGDDYSFDMFSQVGAAVRTQPEVLGDLGAERVIALGESQSASRLSTYVNAVAPLANVYDAYLLHSRGGGAAALQTGTRTRSFDDDSVPPVPTPSPTRVRTDLNVPVMVLSSETDVIGGRLGYRAAAQPDTDRFRSWEVAGTAHLDAYGLGIGDGDDGSGETDIVAFDAMLDPPAEAYFGFVTCEQGVNTGGHTYLVRSALHSLDEWVRSGRPPPTGELLESNDDEAEYVRDEHGNVLGGIRTPHVDVPVARLAGSGQTGGGFCFLFGVTEPFSAEKLAELYPDHDTFVMAWNAATDEAVAAGFVLEVDGELLKNAAAASSVGG